MEKPFRTVEATPPAPPANTPRPEDVSWPQPTTPVPPDPPPNLGDTTRYAAEITYPAVEQTAPFKLQGG